MFRTGCRILKEAPAANPLPSRAARQEGRQIILRGWLWVESRTSLRISNLTEETGINALTARVRSGECVSAMALACQRGGLAHRKSHAMMELKIQLVPTGEIILPPGKNGESYCHSCAKHLSQIQGYFADRYELLHSHTDEMRKLIHPSMLSIGNHSPPGHCSRQASRAFKPYEYEQGRVRSDREPAERQGRVRLEREPWRKTGLVRTGRHAWPDLDVAFRPSFPSASWPSPGTPNRPSRHSAGTAPGSQLSSRRWNVIRKK
ncbi:hypothetical protein P4O66_018114, partial [Electrophorus voltai]